MDEDSRLEYEAILDKEVLPQTKFLVDKSIPVKASPSILDEDFSSLVKMDIEEVKEILIKELDSLELVSDSFKDIQLQKIFTRLFSFQSDSKKVDFESKETRFYIDLISMEEIYTNSYIRDFLSNRYNVFDGDVSDNCKYLFLEKLYNYYDTHNYESISKINYILRSSNNIVLNITYDPEFEFEDFFSDRVMSSFDKEELSQLFRFYLYSGKTDILLNLFNDEKALWMISEMTKMVKELTGHGSEFLYSTLNILDREYDFYGVLESFYDKFKDSDLNRVEVRELINYMISYSYDLAPLLGQERIYDVDSFMKVILENRERSHYRIFKEGTLSKIENGSFDRRNDFKEIYTGSELDSFKKAILYNIYGIDLTNARVLIRQYGAYLDSLDDCVLESDKDTLSVLKSIKEIVDLDIASVDFRDRLNVLRSAYYDYVSEKGLNYKNTIASMVILEGLCSKMIMHTYNERLLDSSSCKVIGSDNGVVLLDAGVNFDIVLTAIGAVGDFFGSYENFSNKWNTSYLSENQGLCVSHISNQNMGVINYAAPFLGFVNLPEEGLNTMGPYDIYSHVATFNLRRDNNKLNRLFVPAHIMSDETRFGYNELLIDRFLMNDSYGNLKIQPSYVVFFKVGDTEDNRLRYQESLQIAKDLNIPIMVVDVVKVKNHEKEEIEKMEEDLFSNNNYELIDDIITRYMNNYTGAIALKGTGYGDYPDDFSVKGMSDFLGRLVDKINSLSLEEKEKWTSSLKEIYLKEKEKYASAKKIILYENSVDKFLLDELGLGVVIEDINLGKDKLHISELVIDDVVLEDVSMDDIIYGDPEEFPKVFMSDGSLGTFFSESNFTSSVKVIVDFVNMMGMGSSFKVDRDVLYRDTTGVSVEMDIIEDTSLLLIENLALVYFTEDFSGIPTVELQCLSSSSLAKPSLSSDFDLLTSVKNSEYDSFLTTSGNVLSSGKIDRYIEKIESISDKEFISVFKPMIDDLVKKENTSFEELSLKLLDKKHNMRDNFIKLRKVYCDTDSNDLNKGKR